MLTILYFLLTELVNFLSPSRSLKNQDSEKITDPTSPNLSRRSNVNDYGANRNYQVEPLKPVERKQPIIANSGSYSLPTHSQRPPQTVTTIQDRSQIFQRVNQTGNNIQERSQTYHFAGSGQKEPKRDFSHTYNSTGVNQRPKNFPVEKVKQYNTTQKEVKAPLSKKEKQERHRNKDPNCSKPAKDKEKASTDKNHVQIPKKNPKDTKSNEIRIQVIGPSTGFSWQSYISNNSYDKSSFEKEPEVETIIIGKSGKANSYYLNAHVSRHIRCFDDFIE